MKLFLLGGFLGSGKTTAIARACQLLAEEEVRVGVITNDQGSLLVDSAYIQGLHIDHQEVIGGCFCCNYHQLEAGIQSFEKGKTPDIIFAESVGSCTDVVATVIKPLLQSYPNLEIVFSVFADATFLLKMKKEHFPDFDGEVHYIYEKQLLEADVLVMNKKDLITTTECQALQDQVDVKYPDKKVLFQNSLCTADIKDWIETLSQFSLVKERRSLDIDYDKYGEGERALAWMDAEWELESPEGRSIEKAIHLINALYDGLCLYPIGHLKFLLKKDAWQKKISFISRGEPKLRPTASLYRFNTLTVFVNARVQSDPEILKDIVVTIKEQVAQQMNFTIVEKQSHVFRPGIPEPTYRI